MKSLARFGIVGLLLLLGIGILRIVSTYHVFNHTIDEGAHLACGIQWFQNHYDYDPKHTPIARISIALLPYLDGLRGYGNSSFWVEGVAILSTGGRYWHNLTLARLGVLPFFVLAVVVVYLWTRRLYGTATALVAAGIFSTLPIVLGHSAIATTDIPLTAMFLVAAWAFTRWLALRDAFSAARCGLAVGLAIATKLSTLAFLPAVIAGVLPLYYLSRRSSAAVIDQAPGRPAQAGIVGSVVIGAGCAMLLLWAVYRFSYAPIDQLSAAPEKWAARVFGSGTHAARAVHVLATRLPLPAPEFFSGLRDLRRVNDSGVRSYLFGQVKPGGWWYFYPVALALKTPIAVLLLAMLGAWALVVRWLRSRTDWERAVPLVAAVALILVVMPTRLDIGVRHIMPVFAFLSMLAAVGTITLWQGDWAGGTGIPTDGARLLTMGRAATVVLLGWCAFSSVRAHPDYLAYVNELGGSNPARILVISDVDWGQDFARLSTYLKENHVSHLSVGADNLFDAAALGLPVTRRLKCAEAVTGWIAIEERRARVYPECYRWISSQPMKAYVGRTMRVYYVAEAAGATP